MTQEQVINMNKLVAEFMELNDIGSNKVLYVVILDGKAKGYYHSSNLLFHSSPEWQIPVLNKIMDIAKEKRWIGFSITTATSFVRHNMKDIVNYVCSMGGALDQKYFSLSSQSSMAEATFSCICKFMQWYNGEKNSKV
jgi:hypothetical protein